MVAETAAATGILFKQSVSVQYQFCVSQSAMEIESAAPSVLSKSPTTAIFHSSESAVSFEIPRSESSVNCSTSIQTTEFVDSTRISKYLPSIRSGSHTDIGPRRANEDEHIRIDDLSVHLGPFYQWSWPSSFYAVFDGHGGSNAAAYVKENAMRFFFEDADLPEKSDDAEETFFEELESCCRRSFLHVDQALAEECSVDDSCGTTAITVLVLGRHLLIANAGDCRAVLCRKGVAVQMSNDHRPSYPPERKRIEDLGGYIEYGYLNGELAVTRALGDWYLKLPYGSASSPLTAEPEVERFVLTEDDEFLIIGCDGIWDVMSNQDAVSLVRRGLRKHDDPQQCAKELIDQALNRDTDDNLTAIVVCFTSSPDFRDLVPSQRPRLRCCNLSEEARRKLRSLLEGN